MPSKNAIAEAQSCHNDAIGTRGEHECNAHLTRRASRNLTVAAFAVVTGIASLFHDAPKAKADNSGKFSVVVEDSFDTQHVNHVYDENGKHLFDQVIYENLDECGNVRVDAWRLLKKPGQHPRRSEHGYYEAIYLDGDTLRRIRSHARQETWTQFDPEFLNRETVPKERRPELRKFAPRPQPDDDAFRP